MPVVATGEPGPYSTGETTVLLNGERALVLRLATDKLGNVFQMGEPLNYHVVAQGPAVGLEASLIDWHGRERKLDKWTTSPSKAHDVVARVSSPGFYRLRVKADGWGEASLDGGVLKPTEAVNSRIGINVNWSDWVPGELIDGAARLLAMENVHWIRTEYQWRIVEWTRGSYNWSQYDLIADACRRHGLHVLPCMFRVPKWASTAPDSPEFFHHIMKHEYFDDYFNYVIAAAKRYPDLIRTVSVWNEVDSAWFLGGTAKDYFDLLKGCSERLKALDPSIETTCSGISATGRSTSADFLRTVLKMGGGRYFDIADCHYMGRERVAQFEAELKEGNASGKPLWITEQSANTVPSRSLTAADRTAADKIKGLIASLACNPEKLFLWEDIDQHPQINPWGNVKGVDRTVRPSYFAFATLIDLLADKRCDRVYSESSELHAYRFGDVVALWSDVDSAVCLEGVSPTVERIDLMGARSQVRASEGRLVVPIGPEPVFFRTQKPPARIRQAAAFVMQQVGAVPGTDAVLEVRLFNMSGRASTAQVSLNAPDGWATQGARVKLRPREEKTVAVRVRVPGDVAAGRLVPVTATVAGLTDRPITAGASIRVGTKKGVLLIEAESAPRSQGQCPGSPMFIDEQPDKSGGAIVDMFWGESWMEYDLPFARPGAYRLSVYGMAATPEARPRGRSGST